MRVFNSECPSILRYGGEELSLEVGVSPLTEGRRSPSLRAHESFGRCRGRFIGSREVTVYVEMRVEDRAGGDEEFAPTFVCSIFELANRSGCFVPKFQLRYLETDTGAEWLISGGGSTVYLSRFGRRLVRIPEDQAADSHFMIDRVVSALLISGAGLFIPSAKGRLSLDVPLEVLTWQCKIDLQPFYGQLARETHEVFDEEEFESWLVLVCQNTAIRRALHDMVQAIKDPVEAFVYIYRGFEWLKNGLNLTWDEIAADLRVSKAQIRQLGRIANDDSGVRHASESGTKQRASVETYGTWIAALLEAIELSRARLDSKYEPSGPKRMAERLSVSMQWDPYP